MPAMSSWEWFPGNARMVMLFSGKVEVIKESDKIIRTVSLVLSEFQVSLD